MQRRTLLFFSTVALALFGGVRSGPLYKRFAGDGTFYSTGLGACGDTNSDNELICAMNAPQYDGSCNKVITITGPKGSTKCTVKDKCPECLFGSVDMSPAAFNAIADPSAGRVHITWTFDDGTDPDPQPSPQPVSPSKLAPKPKPPPSPPPPPPQPPNVVQKNQDDGQDSQPDPNQDEQANSTDSDSSATVNSVSYAFISGDFSLINGGELEAGGNPLDNPDEYSKEIINNVTNGSDDAEKDDGSDGGCNFDQSDDGTDQSGDDNDNDDQSCEKEPDTTTPN